MSGNVDSASPVDGESSNEEQGWKPVRDRLLAQAPDVSVKQTIRLDYYFSSLQNYREQAKQFIDRRDFERAYIVLWRYVNLATKTIKDHKDYKTEKYSRDRKRVKLQLDNVVDTLEKITARLEEKYDNPTEEEFEDKKQESDATAVVAAAAAIASVSVADEAKETKDESSTATSLEVPDSQRWANLRIPTPVAPPAANAPRASTQSVTKRVEAAISLQRIKVPLDLMDKFLTIAYPNTKKDVETCGILGGALVGDYYQVTHLIIPRQEGTSNTVVTYDEEKLIDIQIAKSLITLGWIHTHPSQTCFMSSVDLHTHYGYQIMLPEAIAIVMAPSKKRDSGVFSITSPGMNILEHCGKRGFHHHDEAEGVYGEAPHAEIDPGLPGVEVIQLVKIR